MFVFLLGCGAEASNRGQSELEARFSTLRSICKAFPGANLFPELRFN